MRLPAAVGSGLIGDLPDAIDPEQTMEVDPATGLVRVETELDRGSITHLSHRDEPAHDAPTGRRSPSVKVLGDPVLMKSAVAIDVENPGVFVKGLLELANVILVKCIDIELHYSNDLIVVIRSRSHDDPPLKAKHCLCVTADVPRRLALLRIRLRFLLP